jgi:hypothetical protein
MKFYAAPDLDDPPDPKGPLETLGVGREEGLGLGEVQVGSLVERAILGDVIEYLRIRWSVTLRHDCGCSILIFDTLLFINMV